MAGGQGHFVDLAHVPGADDQPARVRVGLDLFHHVADLVYDVPVRRVPGAPLRPVHRSQVAVRIRPLVPDAHVVFLEVADVGVALQEPDQLVDDGLEVQLLGGDHGKALPQVETHLVAEHAQGACAGTVGLFRPVLAHVAHQVKILVHVSRSLYVFARSLHSLRSVEMTEKELGRDDRERTRLR